MNFAQNYILETVEFMDSLIVSIRESLDMFRLA